MKSSPFKIVILLLIVVAALLPLQWMPGFNIGSFEAKPVGLLSDVLPSGMLPQSVLAAKGEAGNLPDAPAIKPAFRDSCPPGMVCIDDYADETQRGMRPFYEALAQRNEMQRPVRVAYFGDSFIEADILTSDLRDMLQQHYGGCGVGFLDMDPPYAANRASVRQKSGGWTSQCVLDKGHCNNSLLNVGQRYFLPHSTAWTEVKGINKPRLDTTEVHTIILRSNRPATIGMKLDDGPMLALSARGDGRVEAISHTGRSGSVKWQIPASSGMTCWGVAEEGRHGVVVDNFSLRGSSGLTLSTVPEKNLQELNEVRPYDLIVLGFGLNVANKKQTDYSGYTRQFRKVVENMKRCFPQAGILIVGVGDREDKLADGKLHTMPAILALQRYQQNLAADCHVAFWNLFQAMGGEGSIRRMAESKPAEAGKDYTHINARGGKRVAGILFKTLVYGQEQHERRKQYEAEP